MEVNKNDTIAAISTPIGVGGIGIVRLSGPDSLSVADKVFEPFKEGRPSFYESHTVHYGRVKDPSSGEMIDEVLLTVMRQPATYTSEDIVEVSCHGGRACLKKVLGAFLSSGARLAEAGEFTKRAFLNGRIDLTQAEAVLEVILAETDKAQRVAMEHLEGSFSLKIRDIREAIIDIQSQAELAIDFSSEDVEFTTLENMLGRVREEHKKIKNILSTADKGIMLREGASIVICGKPNVGKSRLMNALLKHERVIVTPVAGTTRDVIEESINISGVKVRLSDTAGIIETSDSIEAEGIKRSKERIERADLALFVLDSSIPFSDKDREVYNQLESKKTLLVANKTDLPPSIDYEEVKKALGSRDIIKISALKAEGLELVEDAVAKELFSGSIPSTESSLVTSARHKECLSKSLEALERSLKPAEKEINAELLSSDLTEAVHQLGLIIGESISRDVLDRIFSNFCIGK